MAGKNQAVLLLATLVVAAFCGICSAVTYTVGDTTGWTVPSSASFYSNWVAGQTFSVGDVLVFNFPAGAHTVAEVSSRNFNSCNTANTIGAVHTTSPTNITLTAGTHNFICTVATHCSRGQRLSVVVTGPSAAPSPSGGATSPSGSPAGGATSPSGTPTIPTTEGPSTTMAPPPNSATCTSVGLLSLMTVAVAAVFMF